jgi:hypothetical protein
MASTVKEFKWPVTDEVYGTAFGAHAARTVSQVRLPPTGAKANQRCVVLVQDAAHSLADPKIGSCLSQ